MKVRSAEQLLQLIKRHRVQSGFDSTVFSSLAGVSAKFLSQLENEKTTVETDIFIKVSQALGLRIPFLDDPKTLALSIKTRRKSLGLDQAMLASLCNVSPKFLSALENAHSKKRLNKVFDVLIGLGLDMEVIEP